MNGRFRYVALAAAAVGATCCAGAEDAPTTVSIDLPAETAQLQPGPGVETATAACLICHSVDYITMQPPLTKEQWRGEVLKMKHSYGAPFADSDVDVIVGYLMSQNGKP